MGSKYRKGSAPALGLIDGVVQATTAQKVILLLAGITAGYLLGYVLMETADTVYASHRELLDKQHAALVLKGAQFDSATPPHDVTAAVKHPHWQTCRLVVFVSCLTVTHNSWYCTQMSCIGLHAIWMGEAFTLWSLPTAAPIKPSRRASCG